MAVQHIDPTLKELLDFHAARVNSPEFVQNDPVQFPRLFTSQRDIEIVSLLCSTIAWGNRKMICADCAKMLALMDNAPYRYVMERGYDDLPEHQNIHRTFLPTIWLTFCAAYMQFTANTVHWPTLPWTAACAKPNFRHGIWPRLSTGSCIWQMVNAPIRAVCR